MKEEETPGLVFVIHGCDSNSFCNYYCNLFGPRTVFNIGMVSDLELL